MDCTHCLVLPLYGGGGASITITLRSAKLQREKLIAVRQNHGAMLFRLIPGDWSEEMMLVRKILWSWRRRRESDLNAFAVFLDYNVYPISVFKLCPLVMSSGYVLWLCSEPTPIAWLHLCWRNKVNLSQRSHVLSHVLYPCPPFFVSIVVLLLCP